MDHFLKEILFHLEMLMSKITRCDIDCRMIDLPSTWTMPWSYFWIGEDDQFPWVKRYGPGQTRRRDRLSVAISTGSQSSLQNNPSQRQSQWCDRSILTHNIYSLGLIDAHFAGDEEFVQNGTVRSYIFALLSSTCDVSFCSSSHLMRVQWCYPSVWASNRFVVQKSSSRHSHTFPGCVP